jgi:tetratricopeptide (TPR) repeat protein
MSKQVTDIHKLKIRMKKKLSILLILLATSAMAAYSQDYRQEADKCLTEGDYDCVKRNLQLYQEDGTEDVSQQIQDAEDCMKARILADNYFEEKEYEKAAKQYEKILKLNPKDAHAKKRIDLCKDQLTAASPPTTTPTSVVTEASTDSVVKTEDAVLIQAPTSQSTAVVSLPLQPIQTDPNAVLSKGAKKALKAADEAYETYAKKLTAMSKSRTRVANLTANTSPKEIAKATNERNHLIDEVAKLKNDAARKQATFYGVLADGYFEEKNYDKAVRQYEKILKLNPKDGHAKKQYDLCMAQQSREPAENETVAQKVEQTPPKAPETLLENSMLTAKGANISANGKKLKRAEVSNLMANTPALKLYNDGKSRRNTGMWLIGTSVLWPAIGAGIGAAIGGTKYVVKGQSIYGEYLEAPVVPFAIIGGAVGLVCIGKGIQMCISGKKSIHKAVDTNNNLKKTDPDFGVLQMGITPNGVGLVYNF